VRAFLLALLLCLTAPVLAKQAEAVKAATTVPDAGPAGRDQQIRSNTARIEVQEKMSGNQAFILQLVSILIPVLVLIIQMRQNGKITAMAKSVDGMKDELVVEVRKAATLQGAKTERESQAGKRKAKLVR
jgi:hypothetical protein